MSPKRSLVIFPGALGDFLCLLPALEVIARSADVDLYACSEFGDLVPQGITVYSLERYEIRRLFNPGADQEMRVRNFFSRYDRAYSWLGSREPVFVQNLQEIATTRTAIFPFQSHAGGMHQTEYYMSCLGRNSPTQPVVELRAEARAWCEDFWLRHSLTGRAVLVMAPGSGAREKNWPVSYYQTVARWWRRRSSGSVLVLIGPVEEERGGMELLRDEAFQVRNLTLAQVSALLARSDFYLGNDNGISHLAASVGTPVVALFGPSDVRQWAPRGPQVVVLSRGEECAPCAIATMKSCSHRNCLTLLQPDDVIRAITRSLATATLTRVRAQITV